MGISGATHRCRGCQGGWKYRDNQRRETADGQIREFQHPTAREFDYSEDGFGDWDWSKSEDEALHRDIADELLRESEVEAWSDCDFFQVTLHEQRLTLVRQPRDYR